jgi:hypothetical protein
MKKISKAQLLCGVLSAGMILSLVSPQFIRLHGLRSILPMMLATSLLATFSRKQIVAKVLAENRIIFFLGMLFLLQSFVRFHNTDIPNMRSRDVMNVYVISSATSLLMVFFVFSIGELGEKVSKTVRRIILFVWSISLTLGIPTLLSRPFVARLTMANPRATEYSFQYGALGIGNYLHYTSFAIAFLPMLIFALTLKGMERIAAIIFLIGGSIAVYLSSFTMAAALLTVGIVSGLMILARYGKGNPLPRLLTVCLVLVSLGFLGYSLSDYNEQIFFIYSKFQRLVSGLLSEGFAQGDETGRGAWFVQEMEYFFSNSRYLFGFVSGNTDFIANGHSSLADTLVVYGVAGMLWIGVMIGLFRKSWISAASNSEKYAAAGAYLLLVMSGILNPTWYYPEMVIPLAFFTIVRQRSFGTRFVSEPRTCGV